MPRSAANNGKKTVSPFFADSVLGGAMDLRKLKKLIDLVQESGIAELEITEGEEKVKIVKGGLVTTSVVAAAPALIAAPPAAAAVEARPAAGAAPAAEPDPGQDGHV